MYSVGFILLTKASYGKLYLPIMTIYEELTLHSVNALQQGADL